MKAAFIQFNPSYLEVQANWDQVQALLSGVEADLIVLPELFTSGYFFQSEADLASVAEEIPDGPTTVRLKDWARAANATIVAGLAERSGDAFFNSAAIVDPSGYRGTYRKIHLYYEEKTLFSAGDLGFPVYEVMTEEGHTYRVGTMICFDWYFPEAARSLALNGADVIAHPANLVLPHCPDAMPIRARENHVFTITANRYGQETKGDETLTFIGQSEICGPDGTILYRSEGTGDEIGIVDIDPHDARDRRLNAHNDIFADRRPDVYASSMAARMRSSG